MSDVFSGDPRSQLLPGVELGYGTMFGGVETAQHCAMVVMSSDYGLRLPGFGT